MKNSFLVTWGFSSSFPAVFLIWKLDLSCFILKDVLLDLARPFLSGMTRETRLGQSVCRERPWVEADQVILLLVLTWLTVFIGFILWVGTTRLGLLRSVWSTDLVIPRLPCQLQSETCLALFSGSRPWLVYLYYYIIENSLILLATCDWD